MTTPNADPNNVQGDILVGVPKKAEIYYFFRIDEQRVAEFRKNLGELVPLITTASQLLQARKDIEDNKRTGGGLIKLSGVTIGFSNKGLQLLGLTDHIDPSFEAGQLAHAKDLGDAGKDSPEGTFDPDWDPAFKEGVHGLITIAGDCNNTILEQLAKVEKIFQVGQKDATIQKALRLVGNTRPGDEDGHEHFGFADGVSQPAIDVDANPVKPDPGQFRIPQGVVLLGRDGDKLRESRPAWSVDGSILAFRYLPQLVPEFDLFLKKNPLPIPGLSAEQGSELLGARFVGRWKSGAPLDLTPLKDDPSLGAKFPDKTNDYQFAFPEDDHTKPAGQTRCPFAAHVRKTNPRNDLGGQQNFNDHRILRRGIQFGPEVTDLERQQNKTLKERGLLFACFQSNLADGFEFIQESWANNRGFIFGTAPAQTPGIDPIIGQVPVGVADVRSMSGTDSADPSKSTPPLPVWVLSKGGEYFFTPSIPSLKANFAGVTGGKTEL